MSWTHYHRDGEIEERKKPMRDYCWDHWKVLGGPEGPRATVCMDRDDYPVAGFCNATELLDGFLLICACVECQERLEACDSGIIDTIEQGDLAHVAALLSQHNEEAGHVTEDDGRPYQGHGH